MIEPQIRCVELVELVTEWMEGGLDDQTRAYAEEHLVIWPRSAMPSRPCRAWTSSRLHRPRATSCCSISAPSVGRELRSQVRLSWVAIQSDCTWRSTAKASAKSASRPVSPVAAWAAAHAATKGPMAT